MWWCINTLGSTIWFKAGFIAYSSISRFISFSLAHSPFPFGFWFSFWFSDNALIYTAATCAYCCRCNILCCSMAVRLLDTRRTQWWWWVWEKRIKITSILWYVVLKHLIQYIWLNGCNKSAHTHTAHMHTFRSHSSLCLPAVSHSLHSLWPFFGMSDFIRVLCVSACDCVVISTSI